MDYLRHQARLSPFKYLSTFILAASASAIATVSTAETGEQFSLDKQPDLLFDGGGSTLTGEVDGIPYSIIQGYAVAQGDMVLGRLGADGRLEIPVQKRGLGQSLAIERWLDGIVPYQFAEDVSQIQRDRAIQAIAHWNANTSLKLIARTPDNEEQYKDYVNFQPSNGCASWVGRRGGEQTVWLGDTCTTGSIIHELGHAIGLFHEHTRSDRDNFVTINTDNISDSKEINFEIIEVNVETYSDYDYGSIMHYGAKFFSNNGEPTISAPDNIEIGQRVALSQRDIDSVNNMYATDIKLDVSTQVGEENSRIDLLVSNIGNLGANTLELTATLADEADWLSISKDSGWDCKQFDAELRCTRPTLIENSDSSFAVLVDLKTTSIDDLKVRVESKTLDVDFNNNTFNDEIPEEQEEIVEAENEDNITIEDPETDEPSGGTDQDPNAQPEPEPEPTPQPELEPEVDNDNTDAENNSTETESNPQTPLENNPTTTESDAAPEETDPIENIESDNGDAPELGEANSGGSGGGGAAFYLLGLLAVARIKALGLRSK